MRIQVVREIPQCDQEGCGQPAEYGLVWLKQQFYCREHADKMLAIGEAMAHPTPAATIAELKREYPTQMLLVRALQRDTLLAYKGETLIYAEKPWKPSSESLFLSDEQVAPKGFEEFLTVENALALTQKGSVENVIEVMSED